MQLSLLISLVTDLNCIKSKILTNNCSKDNGNISNKMNSEEFVIVDKLRTKEKLKTKKKLEIKKELRIEEELRIIE